MNEYLLHYQTPPLPLVLLLMFSRFFRFSAVLTRLCAFLLAVGRCLNDLATFSRISFSVSFFLVPATDVALVDVVVDVDLTSRCAR